MMLHRGSVLSLIGTIALLLVLSHPAPALGSDPDAREAVSGQQQPGDSREQDDAQAEGDAERPGFWKRLVPVPIFITEPAVGNGLGIAIGYFHPEKPGNSQPSAAVAADLRSGKDLETAQKPPPTVTGVVGGYTSNGTYFVGAGHANTFRNDSVRMSVLAGYADVFADIYVLGVPFQFNLNGKLAYGDVKVRIGDLPAFWGAHLSYLDASNRFLLPLPDDPIGILEFDLKDVGLGAGLFWDTRDDPMFPTAGRGLELTYAVHAPGVGSDYDYDRLKFKAVTFHPLGERFNVGGRLQYEQVFGNPPFFAVPWVSLRGMPALRYQGDQVAAGEVEFRYRFAERWVGLAFGGLGWREQRSQDPEEDIYNMGVGGRFLFRPEQNVWIGIDVARGPEDTYWYIQVGQAW